MELSIVTCKKWLCLLLWVVMPFSLFSQDITEEPQKVKYDSLSQVDVRKFDQESIEEYRNDSDFKYERDKEPKTYSIWERIVIWIIDFIRLINGNSTSARIFHITLYVLGGAIIIYAIMRIAGVDIRATFYGKKAKKTISATILEEDIHAIDFDARIAQAVQAGGYREAVRLHYLKSLKYLADHELINWTIDKTNHEYEVEIQDPLIREPFARITYLYESVCYGNFEISKDKYNAIAPEFNVLEVV